MVDHIQVATPTGTFDGLAAGPEDGRQVLFLHGFPESAQQWEYQLGALGANGLRAVAFDQRGYSPGVRPPDVADYKVDELVADVLAVADALGWTKFDLVGHDWGAAVAWHAAAQHADRVRTLAAVSVPHPAAFATALREDPEQQTMSRYMQTFQGKQAEKQLLADNAKALRQMYDRKPPPSRIEDYVQRFAEEGALTAALNWYRAMKFNPPCGPVAVPTLYVWSTEDTALGSTGAFGTAKHVTGPYRFEMLEDVSHWVPEEAPEQLSALLLEHFAEHP
ncbi:alpha/beta fold hydrolase [Labedaea rhizosphaerae]|uniref:alpha/beta fold hydrolase n=1 Tax=Labedaea rhizosphaerae TaxID=598644 RepID=UPI00105BD7BF|nr:alpha/beta hydrolase [Labedaea rhizosphaerae]